MNYQHILREETKNGFDSFMDFLGNDKNLLYEIDEEYIDEKEITVEIFDDEERTDIIGVYYFDDDGNFIKEL